jgi:hypothetical protein
VLDPFERLTLTARFQKRFAFEIEQVGFAHGRLVRRTPVRQAAAAPS